MLSTNSPTKVSRPETKGIHEGVSILELHDTALCKRATTIHKTVIISKASEGIWVGRWRWCKPATVDMDVCRRTIWYACVHYLNTVLRNACCRAELALRYANVFVCTPICNTHNPHNSILQSWHWILRNSAIPCLPSQLLHKL